MDKFLLEYHIHKCGMTTNEFCDEIGISPATYYRKVNGESDFTSTEIKRIADCLNIKDITPIFFTNLVSETTQEEE